jgi:hypothetical protein
MRGYPVATIAWYGPNTQTATKVVVGIVAVEGEEADPMATWTHERDVRRVPEIQSEIQAFVDEHTVRSVVSPGRIIGCPHQTGIDYDGEHCPDPACTFWLGRDRWRT